MWRGTGIRSQDRTRSFADELLKLGTGHTFSQNKKRKNMLQLAASNNAVRCVWWAACQLENMVKQIQNVETETCHHNNGRHPKAFSNPVHVFYLTFFRMSSARRTSGAVHNGICTEPHALAPTTHPPQPLRHGGHTYATTAAPQRCAREEANPHASKGQGQAIFHSAAQHQWLQLCHALTRVELGVTSPWLQLPRRSF